MAKKPPMRAIRASCRRHRNRIHIPFFRPLLPNQLWLHFAVSQQIVRKWLLLQWRAPPAGKIQHLYRYRGRAALPDGLETSTIYPATARAERNKRSHRAAILAPERTIRAPARAIEAPGRDM